MSIRTRALFLGALYLTNYMLSFASSLSNVHAAYNHGYQLGLSQSEIDAFDKGIYNNIGGTERDFWNAAWVPLPVSLIFGVATMLCSLAAGFRLGDPNKKICDVFSASAFLILAYGINFVSHYFEFGSMLGTDPEGIGKWQGYNTGFYYYCQKSPHRDPVKCPTKNINIANPRDGTWDIFMNSGYQAKLISAGVLVLVFVAFGFYLKRKHPHSFLDSIRGRFDSSFFTLQREPLLEPSKPFPVSVNDNDEEAASSAANPYFIGIRSELDDDGVLESQSKRTGGTGTQYDWRDDPDLLEEEEEFLGSGLGSQALAAGQGALPQGEQERSSSRDSKQPKHGNLLRKDKLARAVSGESLSRSAQFSPGQV